MSSAGPSFAKITLAVAAGIILAAAIVVFALTGIGAAAERDDKAKALADSQAIADCRGDAIRRAKTMDQVVSNSQPCKLLEATYRKKWNRDP